MARKLPPFAALRAFEATARHLSITKAADELTILPSAVSHQVKALEVFVGCKLFLREGTGLILTTTGAALVEGLGRGLDIIEASIAAVSQSASRDSLVVHLFHSLATLWLIPHLGEFLNANPDISVQLITKPDKMDLTASSIDIDIRYASERPSGYSVTKLFDEVIYPVVAPNYLATAGAVAEVSDLIGKRLIGCDYEPFEWEIWFKAMGCPEIAIERPKLMFDSRAQSIQAAVERLGVAMDRCPYGYDLIRKGVLSAPFPQRVPTAAAYYMIIPERAASLPRVKRFSAWLQAISVGVRSF